jgi:ubiquinone/menaquinone biosynthesis C-methylase UbiE
MLEIGVGAGTDHLQWARAGLDCHGVDLTDAAIATAGGHLALHGFESKLQRVDAETLPFEDGTFDIVYSWGVIHHSEKPEAILKEIRRVLKPGGEFIGMMYARHSVLAVKLWIKHGLLKLQPWRSLGNVIWNHVESIGTKSYTPAELKAMFGGFRDFRSQSYLTVSDTSWIPRFIHRHFPQDWGFYIAIKAKK